MISHYKPDILILLETRICEDKADKLCGRLRYQQWVRVECVGFRGGIWDFWNSSVVDLRILVSDAQFLHCGIFEAKVAGFGVSRQFMEVPRFKLERVCGRSYLVLGMLSVFRGWLSVISTSFYSLMKEVVVC